MGLSEAHITTETAGVFIPELWSLDVIEASESSLVMADLVTRFDDLAAEGGSKIHVPKISNLSANTKVADAEVTLNTTTEDEIEITLDNHKEVSFLIEDIAQVQARPSLRELYTKKAGYAIAKAIDTHLLSLYGGLGQSVDATGSPTDEEFDNKILDSMGYLDLADAPMEDRFMVIHPSAKKKLLSVDKFVQMTYRTAEDANAPVSSGFIGELYGMKVYVSSNTPSTTVSGATTHHNLIFNRGAFALAVQLGPRAQANYIPTYLGWLVTIDVIYGYAGLRDSYAVDFLTT
jgi:hypothetical protein